MHIMLVISSILFVVVIAIDTIQYRRSRSSQK